MKRRKFIISTATFGSLYPFFQLFAIKNRKFKISLNPGSIGASYGMSELIDVAIKYGFEGISPNVSELQSFNKNESNSIIEKIISNNIHWDSAGLPVDFRSDEKKFLNHLNNLEGYCKTMKKFNINKLNTWIMPTHDKLTYNQNFKLHSTRLKKIGDIINKFGIKLGLEYVGVRTLMNRDKYPFIHTINEVRDLIENVGLDNIRYQLDSFHWYCSQDTIESYEFLNNEDIITVDLNDAVIGRDPNSQLDYERELPASTGVINIKEFINFLIRIEYSGSVRAEPFNKKLALMDDEAAVKLTSKHLFKSINGSD